MEDRKFEEQQQFRQWWVYLIYVLLFSLFGLFIYADIEQIIFGRPFGDKPASNFVLLFVTFILIMIPLILYKVKLETRITKEAVFFRWKPFHSNFRKIDWSNVDRAEIINYGFVGYGWRLTPYGSIFNVAGNKGLQLILKSGKKIVLGTQKPKELTEFLKQINQLN